MRHFLLITSRHQDFAAYSYYEDWLKGFLSYPDVLCDVLDIQSIRSTLNGLRIIGKYDLIAFLHSSFPTLRDSPRLGLLRALLTKVQGPRVFFLNNEFRSLDRKCQMATYLGAKTLVSQLNLDDAELLYRGFWPHQIISLPYGFTPQNFQPQGPPSGRPIHIGFRGDYYPAYVGHDDRDLLLDDFRERVAEHSILKTDIRVGERLDTAGWAAFLNQCRCLIGHEAGAARIDPDENIRRFINAQEKRLDPTQFRQLVLTMRDVGVFQPPPSGRIAAPRNFEAMATQTVQVLLPGRYNDVLVAGKHYIELQRDFSNLDAVIETVLDDAACDAMAERAYEEALAHHTYQHRIDTLMEAVAR